MYYIDKLLLMELQHTRAQKRMHQHFEAANKVNNAATAPTMKQVIFWIMMILAFVCIISAGMVIINFALHAKL